MSRYTRIGGAGHVTALRRFLVMIVTCMLYVYYIKWHMGEGWG